MPFDDEHYDEGISQFTTTKQRTGTGKSNRIKVNSYSNGKEISLFLHHRVASGAQHTTNGGCWGEDRTLDVKERKHAIDAGDAIILECKTLGLINMESQIYINSNKERGREIHSFSAIFNLIWNSARTTQKNGITFSLFFSRVCVAWFVFLLRTVLNAKVVLNFLQLEQISSEFRPAPIMKFESKHLQSWVKALHVLSFSKEICFMFVRFFRLFRGGGGEGTKGVCA